MKKLSLLCAFIVLALVFSSCDKRVSLDGSLEEKSASENLANVTLSASFSDVITRAYPSTPEGILKARVSFENVRVVFYEIDANNKPTKVAYSFDFDIKALKGQFSGMDYVADQQGSLSFKIKSPMRISCSNYHVYIIAGATEGIKKATAEGSDFSLLSAPFAYEESNFIQKGYLVNSIFINSNPIVITKKELEASVQSQSYQVKNSSLAPINAFVSVEWEPVVNDTKLIISKNSLSFVSDVNNRKFTLFPQFDQTVKEQLNENYPIDANYSGYGKKSIEELSDDFIFLPFHNLNGSEAVTAYRSTKDVKENTYMILPENTMDANDYFGNVVTRIIVMAFIFPADMDLTGVDINDVPWANRRTLPSWILYNGKGYSEKEFENLYAKCEAATTKTAEQNNLIKAYTELKGGKKDYPLDGYESAAIKYFKHGVNYYSIPIQHFTSDQLQGKNIPGQFGVVRNTHYVIRIKSFQTTGATSIKNLGRAENFKEMLTARSGSFAFEEAKIVEKVIDTLY